MAYEFTIEHRYTRNGVAAGGGRTMEAGAMLAAIRETIPGDSANLQIACAFDYTKATAYVLRSTRDMVVEFNNSTAGVPTINLKAGVQVAWHDEDPHAKLFTANVTTAYATLAAGADAELVIEVYGDPT